MMNFCLKKEDIYAIERKNEDALKMLKKALAFTFGIGLIANSYCFFNFSPTVDSTMLVNEEGLWNLSLGRFVIPAYLAIRSKITIPWVIGCLSLFYIALSVYCVCSILKMKSTPEIALVSGVFTVNVSLADNFAAYLHTADFYMFALLLSCLGVYFLKFNFRFGVLWAAICFVGVLGIYQSYISVSAGLITLSVISSLLEKEEWGRIFGYVKKAILSVIISAPLYLLTVKGTQLLFHVEPASSQNGIEQIFSRTPKELLLFIPETYRTLFRALACPYNYTGNLLGIIDVILIICAITMGIVLLRKSKAGMALFVIGVATFPCITSIAVILSLGTSNHMLMYYPYQLVFVAVILVAKHFCAKRNNYVPGIAVVALILANLFINGIVINGAYTQKEVVYESTIIECANILRDIEKIPDYEEGITPVVFVGDFNSSYLNGNRPGLKAYDEWTGFAGSAVTYHGTFSHMARNILGHSINLIEEELDDSLVKDMPQYPNPGYCIYDGEKVIVKIADE